MDDDIYEVIAERVEPAHAVIQGKREVRHVPRPGGRPEAREPPYLFVLDDVHPVVEYKRGIKDVRVDGEYGSREEEDRQGSLVLSDGLYHCWALAGDFEIDSGNYKPGGAGVASAGPAVEVVRGPGLPSSMPGALPAKRSTRQSDFGHCGQVLGRYPGLSLDISTSSFQSVHPGSVNLLICPA